jgi:cytochrome c oxidase assembly protein subunit 15
MQRAVRWLSCAATAGMFLVLLMGAAVTNTGSAEGCGRSWPLCHGQFIPEFALQTAIEFSHRAVTGIVGLLIFALAVGAWMGWRERTEIRVLVPLMLGSLLVQSGLGAWAVLAPQSPAVLALHFGISLVAFASVFLTAVVLREPAGEAPRDRPAPPAFRRAAWASLAYVYLVVYLGAYVRHTGASLACLDWPLCGGVLIPALSAPVAAVFAHRLAALGSLLLLAGLALWGQRLRLARPDLARGSAAALLLVILQTLGGGLVVLTRMSLFSTLAHAGVMTLLFGSLSYLCLQVLSRPATTRLASARPPATSRRASVSSA